MQAQRLWEILAESGCNALVQVQTQEMATLCVRSDSRLYTPLMSCVCCPPERVLGRRSRRAAADKRTQTAGNGAAAVWRGRPLAAGDSGQAGWRRTRRTAGSVCSNSCCCPARAASSCLRGGCCHRTGHRSGGPWLSCAQREESGMLCCCRCRCCCCCCPCGRRRCLRMSVSDPSPGLSCFWYKPLRRRRSQVCGDAFTLAGFPPWMVRFSELYHLGRLEGVTDARLAQTLRKYSNVTQRFGA